MTPKNKINHNSNLLSKEIVIENKWTKIANETFKTESGNEGTYIIVERQPALMIIPVIKRGNNISTFLVKQLRYPISKEVWQFPMGTLDQNADPIEHAKKELKEETGLKAQKLTLVGSYFIDPGLSRQECYVYIAEEIIEGGKQNLEDTELGMIAQNFTIEELKKLITENEFIDGWIFPGYFYLNQYLQDLGL